MTTVKKAIVEPDYETHIGVMLGRIRGADARIYSIMSDLYALGDRLFGYVDISESRDESPQTQFGLIGRTNEAIDSLEETISALSRSLDRITRLA